MCPVPAATVLHATGCAINLSTAPGEEAARSSPNLQVQGIAG
jgi:hypothetical protein